MADSPYVALFSDIGGVLGTNGWDTDLRLRISQHFNCDPEEIQARHRLMFDSYERGYMTFEAYLRKVFCSRPRGFAIEEIRDFAFAHSVPWSENIDFLRNVKSANKLQLALLSNEGEGLTRYRVEKFGLHQVADFFVFSCLVHMRKPDLEIWKLALDLAQVRAENTIYIDDREMFVEIAAELGFTAMQYVSLEDTRNRLRQLGLTV